MSGEPLVSLGSGGDNPTVGRSLVRKLSNYGRLTEQEISLLLALPVSIRTYEPRYDVVQTDQPPLATMIVLSGLACRAKMLPDGRRQILGFLVPGDFCDLHVMLLKRRDHAISTITRTVAALLPETEITRIMETHPRIGRLFWVASLVQEGIAREWILSLGCRTAYERMAHLFCELYERLLALDLADRGQCDLPLTQADLADALGLSQVHVNRTLQQLREAGLVQFRGRRLHIADLGKLKRVALFDPGYLHLG